MHSSSDTWRSIRLRWEQKHSCSLADYVRADPAPDMAAYLRKLQHGWCQQLLHRSVIHLDQSFWIEFQKVCAGEAARGNLDIVYRKLSAAVRSGKAVCPVSSASYWELIKQTDPATRLATARTMDELSLGITVLGTMETRQTELDTLFDGRSNTFELVWRPVGMIEVFPPPTQELPHEDMNQLQFRKFLVEVQSEMTLQEVVQLLPPHPTIVERMQADMTAELTRIKAEDPVTNYKDFQQLRGFELASIIKTIMTKVFPSHFMARPSSNPPDLQHLLGDNWGARSIIPLTYATASILPY